MKAEKIRGLEDSELKQQAEANAEQMFQLRFRMSMGQADGLKKYRELKKDRARILTILRERQGK
jgi:large subunit ribosomal protein L29